MRGRLSGRRRCPPTCRSPYPHNIQIADSCAPIIREAPGVLPHRPNLRAALRTLADRATSTRLLTVKGNNLRFGYCYVLGSGVVEKPPPLFLKPQIALSASEERDRLIKEQIEKDRAAFDARTAKLRALRLAKEAADKAAAPPPAPPHPKRKGKPQR